MAKKYKTNDYGNDLVKERSRLEIYKFANEHLPKDRSRATAIYLASTNDRETTLLDRLCIPRDNRMILESDPNKVDEVRKANPGIKVIPVSTHDFFKYEAIRYGRWWYCGLDYESKLNDKVLGDLRNIRRHNLLQNGGIIYTNVVGQREQKNLQEKYAEYLLRFVNDKLIDSLIGTNPVDRIMDIFYNNEKVRGLFEPFDGKKLNDSEIRYLIDELVNVIGKEILKNLSKDKLEDLRSKVISATMRNWLTNIPEISLSRQFIDEASPGSKIIYEKFGFNFVDAIENRYKDGKMLEGDVKDIFESFVRFWRNDDGRLEKRAAIIRKSDEGNFSLLMPELIKNSISYFKRGNLDLIPLIFSKSNVEGYAVVDAEPFSYRSKRNTTMMLDIMKIRKINPYVKKTLEWMFEKELKFCYTQHRPYLKTKERIIVPTYLMKNFDLNEFESEANRVGRDILKKKSDWFHSMLERRVGFLLDAEKLEKKVVNRKFLGDSSLPPIRLATARKCVLDCLTNEQIESKYYVTPAYWRSIAALRANLTKGTIKISEKNGRKLKSIKPDSRVNHKLNKVSNKIKEEIRDLVRMGLNKEEIWRDYKHHFSSRQQFGAIIAWVSPKLAKKRKVIFE